jgi:site-specific DNA-methyltransferase (adenine-specific)
MNFVEKKLTEIYPYKNNPRNNDGAVDAVAASIKEFGFKVPIVVDSRGEIIAGHTRYKASLKLGLDKVPCIIADDLSPEQIKAFRLADNKVGELAEWDFDLLKGELDGILDIDMSGFGFEMSDFDDPTEAVEDDFEVIVPDEPISRLGDIYQLGEHRLMCGDSTITNDVELLMNGNLADMVFTDPPWNVNYGAVDEDNAQGYRARTIINDSMSTESFKDFILSAFSCMSSASKPGAMIYVVMSAQEWGNLMLSLTESGFHWSSTIIWNKDRLVLSRKDYHTKYEPIWYGWKDDAPRVNPLKDRKQTDVWDFERPSRSDEHPTMKPIALVKKAIDNSSKKGNIILDQFGGSGTTIIASQQANRICYMMELDPKYVDVIINRWEKFTGEKAVKINEII